MSRVEPSLSLPDFMRKHGVTNSTCHRHIRKVWLKTTRPKVKGARQRVTASAEAAWLGLKP